MTRPRHASTFLAGLGVAVALLLTACGDDAATTPTDSASPATTTSTATATPQTPTATATATEAAQPRSSTAAEPPQPDAERAFGHIRVLAEEIGIRPAGSEAERAAAAYIAEQFEAAGYVVAIEEFEATFSSASSSIAPAGEGPPLQSLAMSASPSAEVTAPLVFAGLGDGSDFEGVDAEGAIALLDRGLLTFTAKARNAQAAGAVGVIVVNSEAGPFRGALGDASGVTIPVVAVAGDAGPALRALAEDGTPVALVAEIGRRTVTSQNVVGLPVDGQCTAYLGAHYDSVPEGPGANDNASGTALLIELALTNRSDGLCVVAFGAEEFGLFGSRAFVRDHDVAEAEYMLNFDMVARIGGPRMVAGDAALADLAAGIAAELGHDIPRGSFPRDSSSDHASFSQAGVPAITVHSGGAEFIHTAQDAIDTVFVEDLAVFLEVSTALLRTLAGS